MRINNNIPGLKSFNSLNKTNESLNKSLKSLSTGLRINSAADDAAGFAVSEKMRTQIYGLDVASKNSQDGLSMLQTAEGALGEINSMLQRMRALAVQASNDSLTSQDRNFLQREIDQIKDQIDRVANTTQFNNKNILGGGCGVLWSSNDLDLSIKINKPLTVTDQFNQRSSMEGNYRIEVRAEPGQAQVQKSNIMLINHENVTMERNINHEAGLNNVSVNNVPAGDYEITSKPPSQSRATVTGVYGLGFEEIDDALKAYTNDNRLLANASILFEVTHVDPEGKSITVNAISHVLKTDGTTEIYTQENIILTENQFTDLSSALGVGVDGANKNAADGGFELQLNKMSAFSEGDKFVYNLNVARDIEGADRTIKIESSINPAWPESWKDVTEVEKTNEFKPQEHVEPTAKVVFLIDDSSSMGSSFTKLRENMSAFISKIQNEGVDDIKVGVARFTNGLRSSSYDWFTTDSQIKAALSAAPRGGSVDIYKSVVETVSNYDFSDAGAKHIVLITDTYNELGSSSTYKLSDAQSALASAGITLSAVYNTNCGTYDPVTHSYKNDHVSNLISPDGIDMGRQIDWSNYSGSGISGDNTWGDQLVYELGQRVATDAIEQLLETTPLYQLRQFIPIFADSSSDSRTVIITKDGVSTPVDIEPTWTLLKVCQKFDEITGGTTKAEIIRTPLEDDPAKSEIGFLLTTDLKQSTRVRFSGDRDILNIIGMRSCLDLEFGLDASKVTQRDIHFRNFYLNSDTGKVYDGDIILTTTDKEIPEYSTLTNFEAAYVGQIPKHDVKISDINNFWNTEGVFLANLPKTITITQGDGNSTQITLYKTDTIEDVRKKLNNAIAHDLDQKRYADTDNFVSFVYEGENLNQYEESVAGTFIIRSVIPGKAGELKFSCDDDDLLRAFGFNTIRESSESTFTASAYDAHTGEAINNNFKASGTEFKSILPPEIDININPMAGIRAEWNNASKRYVLKNDINYSAFIHVKDNSTTFQIGANQGEDMIITFSDMSSNSLDVKRVIINSSETARRALTQIDKAINTVSTQRAKIGAYENSLERTIDNLTSASSNITNAESRIREADISNEMMNLVKLQILNQSGASILAQANQLSQSVLSLLSQ